MQKGDSDSVAKELGVPRSLGPYTYTAGVWNLLLIWRFLKMGGLRGLTAA